MKDPFSLRFYVADAFDYVKRFKISESKYISSNPNIPKKSSNGNHLKNSENYFKTLKLKSLEEKLSHTKFFLDNFLQITQFVQLLSNYLVRNSTHSVKIEITVQSIIKQFNKSFFW